MGKPVLYTVFRTRGELVTALLQREHQCGIQQVRAAMPDDLTLLGPTGAYAATVSAFLQVVLENPTRWLRARWRRNIGRVLFPLLRWGSHRTPRHGRPVHGPMR